MLKKEELIAELEEIRYSIKNNSFNMDKVKSSLLKIDQSFINYKTYISTIKSNIVKSFMVTFNVSNFSDLTILFINNKDKVQIVEYAGSEFLLAEFRSQIETDRIFYKDTDNFKIKGEKYNCYYESMENNKGIYTILTITESVFFKPSKFHMLCDILMDIIRSADISRNSIFNDLFEDTEIRINSYINTENIHDPEIYLFKFENIYDFFLKMGLEIIIELSETIEKKLIEVFGDKSSIFRFTLSEFIVITSGKFPVGNKFSDLNNCNVLDFNYKGIVLQHRCIKIPFAVSQSIYDIFENIYLINNK